MCTVIMHKDICEKITLILKLCISLIIWYPKNCTV